MDSDKPTTYEMLLQGHASSSPNPFPVLDRALLREECAQEYFGLLYRLGPVFDMLRHRDTPTPMSVAIYGEWGAGKTSAMQWLDYMLGLSNGHERSSDKVRVHTVWFWPWKYHSREDVWRGLISEVIIKSIQVQGATKQRVAKAAKDFGMFLGRSFLHALAGMEAEIQDPLGALKLKFKGSSATQIAKDFQRTNHPERAYLNQFEDTLQTWVTETIGDDERMVVFIDDLDRCMPNVALEVLEALKLYLNIDRLAFVVGVENSVINELVCGHYKTLHLSAEKSQDYLAKMFSIEVSLRPTEQQVRGLLQQQLRQIPQWESSLDESDRRIFEDVIYTLSRANPREMKRLICSSLMHSLGVQIASRSEETRYDFRQMLQVYLVRKVLESRHQHVLSVGASARDRFFGQWSEVIRTNLGAPGFPQTLSIPKWFIDEQKLVPRTETPNTESEQTSGKTESFHPREVANGCYYHILTDPEFARLLMLLNDTDLHHLMHIPYPQDASAIERMMGHVDPVVEEAARMIGKPAEIVSDTDLARLSRLRITNRDVSDVFAVSRMLNLEELDIRGTQVTDIGPLRWLQGLRSLIVAETPVSDLSPIRDLLEMLSLDASDSRVSDLTPLANMVHIQSLNVSGAPISHLDPLSNLRQLTHLRLGDTRISSIEPISHLRALWELDISNTSVSDLEPLRAVSDLNELNIANTRITTLAPLIALKELRTIDISGSQVSDLAEVSALPGLGSVSLSQSRFSDAQVDALRDARPNLTIYMV